MNEKINYGLKIYTDFTEKEIKENTLIFNIDNKEHKEIREENFENN